MAGFEVSVALLEPRSYQERAAISASRFAVECLAAEIERAVRCQTDGSVRDLRVEIHGDEVVLSGHCRTYYTKQMAQHAAMKTAGDCELINAIDVT